MNTRTSSLVLHILRRVDCHCEQTQFLQPDLVRPDHKIPVADYFPLPASGKSRLPDDFPEGYENFADQNYFGRRPLGKIFRRDAARSWLLQQEEFRVLAACPGLTRHRLLLTRLSLRRDEDHGREHERRPNDLGSRQVRA